MEPSNQFCSCMPPYLLEAMAQDQSLLPETRAAAQRTLEITQAHMARHLAESKPQPAPEQTTPTPTPTPSPERPASI